jgi:hypothetical protein
MIGGETTRSGSAGPGDTNTGAARERAEGPPRVKHASSAGAAARLR